MTEEGSTTEPVDLADRSDVNWRSRLCLGAVCIALAVFPFASHAGRLGIAPLVAMMGIVAALTTRPSDVSCLFKSRQGWILCLGLFVAWAFVTSFWSPYNDEQQLTNPVKIALGVPLYLLSIPSIRRARPAYGTIMRHGVMAAWIIGIGLLLIDVVSGYALTYFMDPLSSDEDLGRKLAATIRNVSGSTIVMAAFAAPVSVIIHHQFKLGWFWSALSVGILLASAVMIGMLSTVLILILMFIVMWLAAYSPDRTLQSLTGLGIISILFAPLMGYLAYLVPQSVRQVLPASAEHRLEGWAYTTQKISEAPVIGHGFDASRTFDDLFMLRGTIELPYVSLHPHNAGLQIWVETGLIGAILGSLTVLALGRKAEAYAMGSKPRAVAASGLILALLIICNVSFGVWQDWWWACMIFLAGILCLIPTSLTDVRYSEN